MAAVGAGYVVTTWFASQIGMKASGAWLDSLLTRLGDRLIELPVAWFGQDRSGLAAGIATQGAMFVSNMPYAILRQILIGFITPGTVLAGMYVFDWRLAVAMTVMVPVILFGYRWLQRAIGRGDVVHAEAVTDASNRVIEFARAQPALRTAGEGSIADRLVADALQNQHRAYRGLLVTGGAGIATFAGLVQLSLTLLLVVGAYLAVGGTVDVATLIALLVLGVRFNEPIVAAGDLGGGVAVARTTLDQLDRLAAVAALPEPQTPAKPADWGIGFEDVTFGYGDEPVLAGTCRSMLRQGKYDGYRRSVRGGQDDDHQAHCPLLRSGVGHRDDRRCAVARARHCHSRSSSGTGVPGRLSLRRHHREQRVARQPRHDPRGGHRRGQPGTGGRDCLPAARRMGRPGRRGRDQPLRRGAAAGLHRPSLAQGRPDRAAG